MLDCTRCGSVDIVRILRRPLFDGVFSIIGRWPYACIDCGKTFLGHLHELPAWRLAVRRRSRPDYPRRKAGEIPAHADKGDPVGSLMALWQAVNHEQSVDARNDRQETQNRLEETKKQETTKEIKKQNLT